MAGTKAPKHGSEDDDSSGDSHIKNSKLFQQVQQQSSDNDNETDHDLEEGDEAQPIGDVIRVSDDGDEIKKHFKAFSFDGNSYQLEDPILVAPEEGKVKPSVTVIKDIFQTEDGSLMVSAQRFFRPEEAERKGGKTWASRDARELFHSYQLDVFSACNVMHKCVIHVVPLHKPLPDRKQHPGFIVRKFYDSVQQKVRNLTEKDCKDVLVQSPAD